MQVDPQKAFDSPEMLLKALGSEGLFEGPLLDHTFASRSMDFTLRDIRIVAESHRADTRNTYDHS